MNSESDFLSKRVERVQNAVRQFPATATNLNEATDKLGTSVSELDITLKKFALGVPTWVPFSKSDQNLLPCYWADEIGYAKIGGKWGIAIRSVEGEYNRPDDARVEQWLFNDSPGLLRMRAVEK